MEGVMDGALSEKEPLIPKEDVHDDADDLMESVMDEALSEKEPLIPREDVHDDADDWMESVMGGALSVKEPLIPREDVQDDDDKGYRKFRGLGIKTSCFNWLIGPVVFIYMFATISSYFMLIEYTNNFFKTQEFAKANLTNNNVTDIFCDVDTNNSVYQAEARATSQASTWNVYYSVAAGIPAIFSNIILGSYTDAFGRKFLLAVGILGTCARLGIQFTVIYLDTELVFLLIACFVEGCTGQYATVLQVSLAYIADITQPGPSRIFGIIFIEFGIGVGLASASFASGFMVESLGYKYAMAIAAGILLVDVVFMTSLLPETFRKEHRHKDKTFMAVVKSSGQFFIENDSENRRWKYQIVFLIHALCNIGFLARIPVETLYQLASPFCWSPTKVGIYTAVRSLGVLFIGLGSIKLLQRCMDEIYLCMLGTVSYAAAFLWIAFVEDDISYYIIMAVGVFGPVATTMQRSILSHLTPPEKQGAIFSAVGTLEVITSLISHVVGGAIYAATVTFFRGLVFIVLGGLNVLCLILLVILKIGWTIETKKRGFQSALQREIIVSESNTGDFVDKQNRTNSYQRD